jgi:hypothetical protein
MIFLDNNVFRVDDIDHIQYRLTTCTKDKRETRQEMRENGPFDGR